MIILSKEQVMKLHASLIKATGGSEGIRDEGMLDLVFIWCFFVQNGPDFISDGFACFVQNGNIYVNRT